MLNETELAKLLVRWRNKYGTLVREHYCVPVNRPDRMVMYQALIHILMTEHGYSEEDMEGNTERRIVEASMSPNSDNREKWKIVCVRDWRESVILMFPKDLPDFDPSSVPQLERVNLSPVDKDPRLEKDNPIDTSVFKDLPPVKDVVDEEFAKLIKEAKGE